MTCTRLFAVVGSLLLASGLLAGRADAAVSCSVSATAAAFGNYDPGSSSPVDTTATITMGCSSPVTLLMSYNLALSAGSSGSYSARTLQNGASTLQYQIYTDVFRSTVWGDGTGVTGTVSGLLTTAVVLSLGAQQTAFGRIPARQNPVPGSFSDSIMITITW